MLEATEPSELPELDAWPSAPAPPELPKPPGPPKDLEPPKLPVPPKLPEPLELLELLGLLERLEVLGLELEPVRRTRTVISSRPGIEGTGTMSCCQCQSALPKALMSPSVVPAVGTCRLSRVSAT